jgi:hypothetical protein
MHIVASRKPTISATMPVSSEAKKPTENGAVMSTRRISAPMPTISPSMRKAPTLRPQLASTSCPPTGVDPPYEDTGPPAPGGGGLV